MTLTCLYYLYMYKKSFNNAVLIFFQSGPALREIWYDNPMILPFGYTICLKIHSKVIGIFWLLLFFKLQLISSVFIQYAGRIQKGMGHTGWASTYQCSRNGDDVHMSIQMVAKQSKYGCIW